MAFTAHPGGRLPALVWSLIVAVLLLTPGERIPDPDLWDWFDKLAHGLAFGLHCALLDRALADRWRAGRGPAVAAALSGLYAGLLEVAQVWVPGRGFEWLDLVADGAGIGAVALLLAWRRASISPAR